MEITEMCPASIFFWNIMQIWEYLRYQAYRKTKLVHLFGNLDLSNYLKLFTKLIRPNMEVIDKMRRQHGDH